MTHDAIMWALIYLAGGFTSNFFGTLEIATFGTMGEHLTNKLRSQTFRTLLHQEMGFFDSEDHTVGSTASWSVTNAVCGRSCKRSLREQ